MLTLQTIRFRTLNKLIPNRNMSYIYDCTFHNALYLLQLFFSGKTNSKQGGYIAVGGLYITPGYCAMQPPHANKGENVPKYYIKDTTQS